MKEIFLNFETVEKYGNGIFGRVADGKTAFVTILESPIFKNGEITCAFWVYINNYFEKIVAICYKAVYNIRVGKTLLDAILPSYFGTAEFSGENGSVSPKKTVKIFAAAFFDGILGSVILFCIREN